MCMCHKFQLLCLCVYAAVKDVEDCVRVVYVYMQISLVGLCNTYINQVCARACVCVCVSVRVSVCVCARMAPGVVLRQRPSPPLPSPPQPPTWLCLMTTTKGLRKSFWKV